MQRINRHRLVATILVALVAAAAGSGIGHATASADGAAPRHLCPPLC
jgi:hypothetical protein